jgi:hypothetical protein
MSHKIRSRHSTARPELKPLVNCPREVRVPVTQQPLCMDKQQIKAQILRTLACSILQELQKALQGQGWYTRYEPEGIGPPRLHAWHPVYGELDDAICVVYRHIGTANPTWFQ